MGPLRWRPLRQDKRLGHTEVAGRKKSVESKIRRLLAAGFNWRVHAPLSAHAHTYTERLRSALYHCQLSYHELRRRCTPPSLPDSSISLSTSLPPSHFFLAQADKHDCLPTNLPHGTHLTQQPGTQFQPEHCTSPSTLRKKEAWLLDSALWKHDDTDIDIITQHESATIQVLGFFPRIIAENKVS